MKFKKNLSLIFLLCCCICISITSQVFASNEKVPGYLWYNLPKEAVKKDKIKRVALKNLSYQMQTKVIKYYMDEALHKAIHTHSLKATEQFIEMQHYFLNQSSAFQHNFEYTLMKRPELDFTVNNPVSSIGSKLNAARENAKNRLTISKLTKNYGLLFFYKGSDVYSQRQSSVLQSFAKGFNFNFIAISVDGVVVPNLPMSRIDNGQSQKLNITHYPTIVLVHPKTKRVLPVAHGFVTQDYLTQKIMVVAKQLKREQFGEGVLYD